MIKIDEYYLLENINTILTQKRKYGKINIGNNKKININLIVNDIKEILGIKNINKSIHMDNLSRILSFIGYTIHTEYYLKKQDNILIEDIKNKLNKYRIEINNINTPQLNQEEILTKLRYTNNCDIKDNKLYLNINNYEIELINDDGNYNDIINDIAYHIELINNNYDILIDIIDNENIEYMNNIKDIIKLLGYNTNIVLIPIQNINYNLSLEELDINTIRYIFTNIKKELDTIDNNKIYYIEYTISRICSILTKNKKEIQKIDSYTTLTSTVAYNMLNKLYEFKNIIKEYANSQETNLISNYVYNLTILINSYLEEEQILNKNNSIYTKERLNLLQASLIVLDNALDLIGIIPKDQI